MASPSQAGRKAPLSDGNHYLHLFDETYRRVEALKTPPEGHDPKYVGNVDTTPMMEIAKTLPLSSVKRPEWIRRPSKSWAHASVSSKRP